MTKASKPRGVGLGTTLSESCFNNGQAWCYELLVKTRIKHELYKLCVDIRKDYSDSQSYARVYVWAQPSLSWQLVINQYIIECECAEISYGDGGIKPEHFHADALRLLKLAVKVLD